MYDVYYAHCIVQNEIYFNLLFIIISSLINVKTKRTLWITRYKFKLDENTIWYEPWNLTFFISSFYIWVYYWVYETNLLYEYSPLENLL